MGFPFVRKLLVIIFISLYITTSLYSDAIFGVGGVEPRLTWRLLSKLKADVYFQNFDDPWIEHVENFKKIGRRVIVVLMGPEGERGSFLLSKRGIYPDYLMLINPGCLKLPSHLKLVYFPLLFNLFFPITGKWWLDEFFSYIFSDGKAEEIIFRSYLYYWGRRGRRIPDFFRCNFSPFLYGGKVLIVWDPDLAGFEKAKGEYFADKRIFELPGSGFFIQESNPWYLIAILNSIIFRRIR